MSTNIREKSEELRNKNYRVFLYNFLPLPVSAVALTSHLTTRTRARGKFLYVVTLLYKIVFLYKNLPPTNLELPKFRAFDGQIIVYTNSEVFLYKDLPQTFEVC